MRRHDTILSFTLNTLAAIVFLWFSLNAALLVPAALKMFGFGEGFSYVLELLRWLVLFLFVNAVISVIYR